MPKFYRKKPVVIEAIQWTGDNFGVVGKFSESIFGPYGKESHLEINTLEGRMKADVGDWIIRGIKGEIYPCKPDIFEQTYEPVERQ